MKQFNNDESDRFFPPFAKMLTRKEIMGILKDMNSIESRSGISVVFNFDTKVVVDENNLRQTGRDIKEPNLYKSLAPNKLIAKIDHFACRQAIDLCKQFPNLTDSVFKLLVILPILTVEGKVIFFLALRTSTLNQMKENQDRLSNIIISHYSILGQVSPNHLIFPEPVLIHKTEPIKIQFKKENQLLKKSVAAHALNLMFTHRQIDVLKLINEGKNDAQIAELLYGEISKKSIKTHRNDIKERFRRQFGLNFKPGEIVALLKGYLSA